MFKLLQSISAALVLAGVSVGVARADSYDDAIHAFKEAGKSGTLFAKAYGYAVFPTVGGAGFVIGAAHGKGRVYAQGIFTGDTTASAPKPAQSHRTPMPAAVISTAWRCSPSPKAA
jgi:hypothetical protein